MERFQSVGRFFFATFASRLDLRRARATRETIASIDKIGGEIGGKIDTALQEKFMPEGAPAREAISVA
jgi:hypothetical protein